MKNLITLTLALWVIQSTAQTWHMISPTTGFTSLSDMSMPDASQGMAVGSDGVILYYDGSGWIQMENSVNEKLNAVHMTGSGKAWAVGESGTVLHYNGSEWIQQNSPGGAVLNDVHILNDSLGWAVGGTILRYDGVEWMVELDEPALNAVHFYDETEGWIVGNYGKTLKYDGNEWSIVTNSQMDVIFEDIVMTGPSSGWRVARTVMGGGIGAGIFEYNGNNWFSSGSGEVRIAYGLAYSDHNHGWAIHNQTMPVWAPHGVYQITHGNWSWSKGINIYDRFTGVSAPDIDNAFVCTQNGFIYHYNNGNWNISNAFADENVYSIDFKSRYYGRIASGKMGIMLIENGSWSSEFNDGHFMFNHVSFPQAETGFATANTDDNDGISWLSRVYMYSNGQWDQILQLGENRHPVKALYAIDENNAWIASSYCSFYPVSSCNGFLFKWNGQGWTETQFEDTRSINTIYFSDPQNGFIAGTSFPGYNGFIKHYENESWSIQYQTGKGSINAFHFFDDGTAWAVGNGGGIYYYNGNVWTASDSPISAHLYAIEMIDQQNGWAAGGNGVLMHFDGQAWNLHEQNLGKTIYAMCFPESGFGLMGGGGGAIFSTELQLPVGIEIQKKHQTKTELSVYPNPAQNICYIRLPEYPANTGNEYFLINIYNSQGVLVHRTRRKSADAILILDTGQLVPGLYLLQVTDEQNNTGQTKLLIQR
jgi:photosystem II stability/assembly factor-like uncharacterized protein